MPKGRASAFFVPFGFLEDPELLDPFGYFDAEIGSRRWIAFDLG